MITKFKIFENINHLPEVGDYVIVKKRYDTTVTINGEEPKVYEIEEIDNEHGGSALRYYINNGDPYNYLILSIEKIECWSNDKEELESYLSSKKYNL
jgi:hypothetical protein